MTEAKAAKAALEALDTEGIDAAHKAVLDKAIEEAMENADAQIAAAEASEMATKPHVVTVEGPRSWPSRGQPLTTPTDVAAAVSNGNGNDDRMWV